MLSVFTPTHDITYLEDAHASLKLQSFEDWEWVIVPNGNVGILPSSIMRDKRVKVIDGGGKLFNVGALKQFACHHCAGDAFVELDHDDLLLRSDTLQKIADAFAAGAGFVYSDTAVFRYTPKQGDQPPKYGEYFYSTQHGWDRYPISVYGRELVATRCFDLTPRALCEILYSPDHVRAWSRDAYRQAGGHNSELPVCDDHQLMIKTYLTRAKFHYLAGCHYLYRLFTHNTVLTRNAKIQELSASHKKRYLGDLIQSWLGRHKLELLDIRKLIASGWDVDRHLLQGFGQNKIGHILIDNVLQKWAGWQVREFMNLAYNALVPGGYLTVVVPEVHSGMGYGDVEWQSHFSRVSFRPYTWQQAAKENGKVTCRFQEVDCTEVFPSEWHAKSGFKYLRFCFSALKGQRQPGLQHI